MFYRKNGTVKIINLDFFFSTYPLFEAYMIEYAFYCSEFLFM